jgi:amino acid adenylation domain-containing protein
MNVVPRWTAEPHPGVRDHMVVLPDELPAAVRAIADAMGMPPGAVLLAAHAKVLAALSAEPEVTTGYVTTPSGHALPCQLTTEPKTWRGLLTETWRRLREAEENPVPFETVLDATTAAPGTLDAETVVHVSFPRYDVHNDDPYDGRLWCRLRYRTDVLDADAAVRIAGYHVTALGLMAADLDAVHASQSLLSEQELRFQLEGLAGPRRELPDRRFHELFEQRVRIHPDRVAAVQGDEQWTYAELNSRANRIGRVLRANGLDDEDVVAVVTERNLSWMAAVLAIFKAGGAYLPIEPHFPAERIATMLTRSGCTLVLTEPASTTNLDSARAMTPGVRRLLIDAAGGVGDTADGSDDGDLGAEVGPDQLAYLYFTSGSTGEPKGAMCEHAGLLNHLFAKIDDLGIGEDQVVAQTAPQCFDISLWQLMSALLVGGRTVVVEQDVILDLARFLDTITRTRVAVLQVVPSYLEVVLTHLEQHPRRLPDLRCVSVTGEAVTTELIRRWFDVMPGVPLVNAYGLTETSDDTTHEVMTRVPDGDRVPLGRPVNNVHAYVLDERLMPVPLGAAGVIAFSGVCVGRGYINDPDRTRLTFMADPHRDGQRLLWTGDYGRWRPDRKLEFLGRRDHQVKVNGFRVEIGEVEEVLERLRGVRRAAVVVADGPDRSRRLLAYYTSPHPLDAAVMRDRLGRSLPSYMVPAAFHWRADLPLTANGKVDRSLLTGLAADLDPGRDDHVSPTTPSEQRMAAAWADILSVPLEGIGRHDNFFDRGGTSLSAVRLVLALERTVSLKDVTRHPVLADLAELADSRPHPRAGR